MKQDDTYKLAGALLKLLGGKATITRQMIEEAPAVTVNTKPDNTFELYIEEEL